MNPVSVYHSLYRKYGPQGWWPLIHHRLKDTSSRERYHPRDYSRPRNNRERFEIAIGAILTQNTTFVSVTECLLRLHRLGGLTPKGLGRLSREEITTAITPARYPNRKAEYLLTWMDFFSRLRGRVPEREEVLSLRGIGEETADSILLYAFGRAEFVIDSYTCRILTALGRSPKNYREAKQFFEERLLPAFPDYSERVIVYQEYHALLVEHAKHHYSRKPYGEDCFLKKTVSHRRPDGL